MKPSDNITDVDVVFPATVKHLIPDTIPDEYPNRDRWEKLQNDWFYDGLPKDVEFVLKAEVNPENAIRHLSCIQRSFEPSHQEKVAAFSYLASLWFENVKYGEGWLIKRNESGEP